MACTKPNCKCWEIEVERLNGEYPKHGFPCLDKDENELMLQKKDEKEKIRQANPVDIEKIKAKLNVPNK